MKKLINPGSSGAAGWHSLQTALLCPRKHRLDKLNPVREESPATVKGSLIHVGLAHHYALKVFEDYLSVAEAIAAAAEQGREASSDPELYDEAEPLAQRVLEAYARHWDPDPWNPVEIESVLGANVGGYPYTQRADLVVEKGGRIYIVDHKTTFKITSGTAQRYTLSGQFLGYQLFGRARWGDRFGGVILNMLGLTDNKFARVPLEEAPAAVEKFKATILRANEIIAQYADYKDDLVDFIPGAYHEHACVTQYGACPYKERCQHGL